MVSQIKYRKISGSLLDFAIHQRFELLPADDEYHMGIAFVDESKLLVLLSLYKDHLVRTLETLNAEHIEVTDLYRQLTVQLTQATEIAQESPINH